jgi:enediyne biosynthesis protein E4
VCVGDVNNDGFEDLYVTNFGPNVLYLNNGDGTFRDFSKESGTDDSSWSSSAAFGDYDKDGDLDLYVSNYLEFDVRNLPQDNPLCRYRGLKVQCGPRGLTPTAHRFYENQGNGKFVDVTQKSGIGRARPYYGLGVVWGDYDNDGDLDIFVANDSTPNYLFRNNGNKTFSEVALLAGVALSEEGKEKASMGVDFGDYDNDGDLDLFVTSFSEDYDTLYRNEGNGQFSDVSYAAGIGETTWSYLAWGTQFVDFDLDGWLDLVIANGHVYPEVDGAKLGTNYRQRNLFFRNLKRGKFDEVSSQAGSGFEKAQSSRGLAVGDINNDGQMDLLIANLDAPPSLLLNRNTFGNWILLKLKGSKSNRSAIGARVWARTGSLVQMREVKSGGSYQSQNDLRVHFGLGSARTIDQLEIRWPGGKVQTMNDVKANQILLVDERE